MKLHVFSKILLISSVLAAVFVSQASFADNRHHRRGYDQYGHYSSYRYNNRYYPAGRYSSYRFGSHSRRNNYFGVSFGNHYSRHRHFDTGEFVGGLILGSLINYPRRERVVYRAPVQPRREVVVLREASRSTTPFLSGRRLLKDLDGNCFERHIDEDGNEIRQQLEPEACNF